MAKCSGITQAGTACKGIPIAGSQWCYVHDPDHAEERRRHGARGGKRGGRGRPQQELSDIKDRLKGLANGVLLGKIDRADAAVCGQLYNTLVRCISVELKAREIEELSREVEELRDLLDAKGSRAWG